jgi:hypothetical protein
MMVVARLVPAEVRGWFKVRSPWRDTRGDVLPGQQLGSCPARSRSTRRMRGSVALRDVDDNVGARCELADRGRTCEPVGVLRASSSRVVRDEHGHPGKRQGHREQPDRQPAAKLALTRAALAVTAYSRVQGKKLQDAGMVPVQGPTEPSVDTPADVAKAQQQLKVCQWAVPALTAGIAVLNVVEGEQQRPSQVVSGILAKPAQLLGIASGS